jgi:putative DNA primase/helicase
MSLKQKGRDPWQGAALKFPNANDILHPPRSHVKDDVGRAREALSYISASDRETWVKMGMSLKSGFGEDGFDTWEAWSRTDESFNERDARDVWKSIDAGGGVSIGTLFYEAQSHGWRDSGNCLKPTPEELTERRRVAAERQAQEDAVIAREKADTAAKALAVFRAGGRQAPAIPT